MRLRGCWRVGLRRFDGMQLAWGAEALSLVNNILSGEKRVSNIHDTIEDQSINRILQE